MSKSSFSKLIESEKPVLIDFFAEWCGPCKMVAPIIKEVKEELGDTVRIVKIDVDKNQALSQKLGIMSMPTLQIYKKGELVWQTMGVQTKQVLLNKLREAI